MQDRWVRRELLAMLDRQGPQEVAAHLVNEAREGQLDRLGNLAVMLHRGLKARVVSKAFQDRPDRPANPAP